VSGPFVEVFFDLPWHKKLFDNLRNAKTFVQVFFLVYGKAVQVWMINIVCLPVRG
jgi:hypothetical protein